MAHEISFTAGGRTYEQDYLSAEVSLRLHHMLLQVGFAPVFEAVAKLEKGRGFESLMKDPELGAAVMFGLYEAAKKLTPEQVQTVFGWLEVVTWITTPDAEGRPIAMRLDGARGTHFKDARDMARYYEFLYRSCEAQLAPFFHAIRTILPAAPDQSTK